MTTKVKPWEEVRDTVAGAESFDDDYGSSYDRIAYDLPNKGNAAGIKPPKPISQMTIGELNDWQEQQMRALSKDYGTKRFGTDDPRSKYGSTGAGRYQFERSTLIDTAKDLYGDNYRNVVYTPDEQEKLAKHLYYKAASRGPEALGNTWHALRDPNVSSQEKVAAAPKPTSSAGEVVAAAAVPAVGLAALGSLASRDDIPSRDVEAERRPIGTLSQWSDPRQLYSVSRSKLRSRVLDQEKPPVREPQYQPVARAVKTVKQIIKQQRVAKQQRMPKVKRIPMVARLQKVDGKMKRVLVPQKVVAENTVRFKDLREKIYEQIIQNEKED